MALTKAEFANQVRTLARRCNSSYINRANNVHELKCRKHGNQDGNSIFLPGDTLSYFVCDKCFEEEFPDIKDAVPAVVEGPTIGPLPNKGAVIGQVHKCHISICNFYVDYHDTCAVCHRFVCPAHRDHSYVCHPCLQSDEADNDRRYPRFERGS